jgi:hypothetical protein
MIKAESRLADGTAQAAPNGLRLSTKELRITRHRRPPQAATAVNGTSVLSRLHNRPRWRARRDPGTGLPLRRVRLESLPSFGGGGRNE